MLITEVKSNFLDALNDGNLVLAREILAQIKNIADTPTYTRFSDYLKRIEHLKTPSNDVIKVIKLFKISELFEKILANEWDTLITHVVDVLKIWYVTAPIDTYYFEYDDGVTPLVKIVDKVNIELIRRGCIPDEVVLVCFDL